MTTTTTHFDLVLLEPSQAQPEVPINANWEALDAALFEAGGSISVKEVGDSPSGNASGVKTLFISGATVEQLTDGGALITITPSSDAHSSDTGGGEGLPGGGTTGQVLTKTSGTDYAVGWSTPSTGGGGGGATNISPDSPPTTPSAIDDEFSGTTLNSKWTPFSLLTGTEVIAQGCLKFSPALNGGARNLGGWSQPIPAAPCNIFAKMFAIQSGYASASLLLATSAGAAGPIIQFGITSGEFVVQHLSNSTTYTANVFLGGTLVAGGWNYLRIVNDGTNLTFQNSVTGITETYVTLYTETIASFLGSVALCGLVADNESGSTQSLMVVDFIRSD